MIIAWLIIAGLLFLPFKRWVATAEAPFLSALLWPLVIGFFLVAIPLGLLFKIIKGNQ
jgi:hypothetical protein